MESSTAVPLRVVDIPPVKVAAKRRPARPRSKPRPKPSSKSLSWVEAPRQDPPANRSNRDAPPGAGGGPRVRLASGAGSGVGRVGGASYPRSWRKRSTISATVSASAAQSPRPRSATRQVAIETRLTPLVGHLDAQAAWSRCRPTTASFSTPGFAASVPETTTAGMRAISASVI